MSRPVVLGLNSAHDAAACLAVDGRIVAAIAEERLSRIKHHEGFPGGAIEYCLRARGLGPLDEVDLIVINEYPETDHALELRSLGYSGRIIANPGHHLLHAYCAWATSNFDDTAILVIDGSGYSYGEYVRRGAGTLGTPPAYVDMEEAESSYSVANGDLSVVEKRWALWEASRPYYRFPSVGHMYTMASQYIFGHMNHAGKTMGLAPYGDPRSFPEPFVRIGPEGLEIDTTWYLDLPPRSTQPAQLDQTCRDLAARVQTDLEVAVLHLCRVLHERTGHSNLCVTGGVGLNSVVNGKILEETPFERLYVTPAAGDSGTAIGAAAFGHRTLTSVVPRWHQPHDFLGAGYGSDSIRAAIERFPGLVEVEALPDAPERAAADLVEGRVVGWFEGGSEFGPRALGHRSILADPRPPDMRDRLNDRVKFREPFRPYAASVLEEERAAWFQTGAPDPYMLLVAEVVPERRAEIPAVVHFDGTCRIQTVGRDHPGNYREVIEHFHRSTGVPLVLNTSFNVRGEPAVETPEDAIRCFLASNLDALYLGSRRLTKHSLDDRSSADLVPVLCDGVSLGVEHATLEGGAQPAVYSFRTRTGHVGHLGQQLFDWARPIDGTRSIAAVAEVLNGDVATARLRFAELARMGLVAMRLPAEHEGAPAPSQPQQIACAHGNRGDDYDGRLGMGEHTSTSGHRGARGRG